MSLLGIGSTGLGGSAPFAGSNALSCCALTNRFSCTKQSGHHPEAQPKSETHPAFKNSFGAQNSASRLEKPCLQLEVPWTLHFPLGCGVEGRFRCSGNPSPTPKARQPRRERKKDKTQTRKPSISDRPHRSSTLNLPCFGVQGWLSNP